MAVEYDEIGIWSEIKLAISREYASAYSTVLEAQRRQKIPNLKWLYIDAYAGPGPHLSKTTGDIVEGSPLIAVNTNPPFSEYHFIDADPRRAELLNRSLNGNRMLSGNSQFIALIGVCQKHSSCVSPLFRDPHRPALHSAVQALPNV